MGRGGRERRSWCRGGQRVPRSLNKWAYLNPALLSGAGEIAPCPVLSLGHNILTAGASRRRVIGTHHSHADRLAAGRVRERFSAANRRRGDEIDHLFGKAGASLANGRNRRTRPLARL